jgi:hypothetical protein
VEGVDVIMEYLREADPLVLVAIIGLLGTVLTTVGVVVVAFMQHGTRKAIRTNHGSKNLGDATDKNTERLIDIGNNLASLQVMFIKHVSDSDKYVKENRDVLAWAEARRRENIAGEGKDPS